MALVTAGWELQVSLGATNDRKLPKTYSLQATNKTEADAAAANILAQLALVSAGKVVSYKVYELFEEDNYTRPTDQDAEWGEEAIVTGKILDHPFKSYTLRIPFPKIDIFVASAGKNRDVVDINDVAVIGYVGLFNSGADAYVSDGEFTESIESGRRDV